MAEHPKPRTEDELLAAIRDALALDLPAGIDPDNPTREVTASHYEQTAQALVTCALAAFEYAAHHGGVTGFQASWALLQVLVRGNGWDGPVLVLKGEDLLYPQYPAADVHAREWRDADEVRRWLRDRARELLSKRRGANETVRDHWLTLAAADVPEREGEADGA